MQLIIILFLIGLIVWAIKETRKTGQRREGRARVLQGKRSSVSGSSSPAVSIEVKTGRSQLTPEEAYRQSRNAWVPPGTSVSVAGRRISDGMVYVGEQLKPIEGYRDTDPALINPMLDAHAKRPDRSGKALDYWPAYADIPRSSRAAYLDWLASGRRDPDIAIGYVFIFFYGLERCILFDAQHDESVAEEIPLLLKELKALRATYAEASNSFACYSRSLLDYARLSFDLFETSSEPTPWKDTKRYKLPIKDRIVLGRMIANGEPLPPKWALTWLHGYPRIRFRTPGRRCREKFNELFLIRYAERFGEGITISSGGPELTVSHQPATASIGQRFTHRAEGIFDVTRLDLPNEIKQLADDVQDELDPYSRWIGRRDDRTSLAALGNLPQPLIRSSAGEEAHGFIEEIERWLDGTERVVIPSEWLVERWPSKNEEYLTKTEAESLSNFLSGFGLGIEPDVRYSRNPSKRDYITLFRLQGDDKAPGENFEAARLLLHLASAVAGADDEVTPEERQHIEKHLEEALKLSSSECARLRAHLARLLRHPPTLRGVRGRAEELSEGQRKQMAKYLLTVAGADGRLDGAELTLLEKIYGLLGLDSGQVHQDLHKLSARSPGEEGDSGPVTVIESDEKHEGYALPSETAPSGERSAGEEEFALDLKRVADVQEETRAVSRVLGEVFEDEGDEQETAPEFQIEGLAEEHESLIAQLSRKPEWPREEFERLAEDHGLMPGFAIEQINHVAFEFVEEPLLEGDDPVEINAYALNALQT